MAVLPSDSQSVSVVNLPFLGQEKAVDTATPWGSSRRCVSRRYSSPATSHLCGTVGPVSQVSDSWGNSLAQHTSKVTVSPACCKDTLPASWVLGCIRAALLEILSQGSGVHSQEVQVSMLQGGDFVNHLN